MSDEMRRGMILFLAWCIALGLVIWHFAPAAHARWKAEYAALSAEELQWYRERQLTPATKARLGVAWNSCCDHSDTVEAQFSKDNGQWRYREPGAAAWKTLPQDTVQEGVPTPHDRPVLFVDMTGRHLGPVCFFPGAAGT